MKLTMKTSLGKDAGSIDLPDEFFGREPNLSLLNQVVLAQLAASRQGTQSTKTRAEVSGGGQKPWRQKGTGRARAGSSRSPIWRGGGHSHALNPRDYSQRTPKKMVRAALLQALSDRAASKKIIVVDDWKISAPKTKDAITVLENLGVRSSKVTEKLPRLLVVVHHTEESVWKSLRGLSDQVQLILPRELNAYDVLCSDVVVFSKDTLEALLLVLRGEHVTNINPMDAESMNTAADGVVTMDDIVEAGFDSLASQKVATEEGAK